MTNNRIKLLSAIWLLIPSYAVADSAANIANDILAKNSTSYSYEGQERAENDRRNHAGRSQDDTNNGKALATAIGTALTAQGVPMVASGVPTLVAIGSALLSKAALEFAQAGADNGVANLNGDQRNILKADSGQNGKAYTANVAALETPELQKLLGDRGVNPQEFTQGITNGAFSTPEQVLAALKETNVSSEDLSAAKASAEQQTAQIISEAAKGVPLVEQIDYDSSHQALISMVGGSVGTKVDGAVTAQTPKQEVSEGAKNLSRKTDSAETKLEAKMETKTQLSWKELFKMNSEIATAIEAKSISGFLESLGIHRPAKQNIFQIAHRNYHGFAHWRKQVELVTAAE